MSRQTLMAVVAVLFVVSGAAGLLYQVVWFKYLSFFLGNTTYAQTVVLATFMGGLAIGAYLWGRKADVSANPLRLYAWLELGIAVYCVFYPHFLELLKSLFVAVVVASGLPSDGTPVLLLKLLVSLLTLLFPTILMGGTLPVLVKFVSQRIEEAGRDVAVLYFLNSFGAVVGSVLAGFFFVALVGLRATIYSAAAVNGLVSVVAFLLSRRSWSPRQREEEERVPPTATHYTDRQVFVALTVAGLSGFAAMVYEVTWVRLLIPFFSSTTYSYSLMLVAFISGITLGSWIVSSVVDRLRNPFGFLAFCQFGVALSLFLTLPFYERIPYYLWHVASLLSRTDSAYSLFLFIQFALSFSIMVVPTVFLGMTLPVASRIVIRSLPVLGTAVGNVFSVNTVGTVLGAISAGLIFIPLVGIRHTLEVGILINILCGFLVLLFDPRPSKARAAFASVAVTASAVAYVVLVPAWNQVPFLSTMYRNISSNTPVPATYEEFLLRYRHERILYYREGSSATVAVTRRRSSDLEQNILYINGKVDASGHGDLPTQVMLGQLPMLLHPNPERVLIIGLGSGVTLGSVLTHPVRSVDCVELSPEVVEASRFFDDVSGRPHEDARTRIIVDDAVAFLKLSPNRYDVIVSEPSNPWVAGVGNLFTREFFRQCKERLTPHGIVVQWFHLYEMDDETFKLVVKTFLDAFPWVSVWQTLSKDVLLVGSLEELAFDEAVVRGRLQNPGVKSDLARIDVCDVASFLSLQMLSGEKVREYAAATEQVNTEDHPRLEYRAPRALFVNRRVEELLQLDERLTFSRGGIYLKSVLAARPPTEEELLNIGLYHTVERRGNPLLGHSALREYVRRKPGDTRAIWRLAEVAEQLERHDLSLHYLTLAATAQPGRDDVLSTYGWQKFQRERRLATMLSGYDAAESERALLRAVELAADTAERYHVYLGELYFNMQRYGEAAEHLRRALVLRRNHEPDPQVREDVVRLRLAESLAYLGRYPAAMGFALQATQLNPRNERAKNLVYRLWLLQSKQKTTPPSSEPSQ